MPTPFRLRLAMAAALLPLLAAAPPAHADGGIEGADTDAQAIDASDAEHQAAPSVTRVEIDPQAAEARKWINSTQHSKQLQDFLDHTVNTLLKQDKRARKARIGVAVLNLPAGRPP